MGVVPIRPADLFPLPAPIDKGSGFLGTKIHPGQENFDVQTLMDSSKQDTHHGPHLLLL